MNNSIKLTGTVAFLMVLGGCTHFDPNLGSTVQNNIDVQTINAYAGFEEVEVAKMDGQKAEQIHSNYLKEEAEVETEKLIEDIGD